MQFASFNLIIGDRPYNSKLTYYEQAKIVEV